MFNVEKKKYELYKKGIAHITVNPGTNRVVRIHLIPPKYRVFSSKPAVAIVNGYYIVPIRIGWYILLYHYIEEVVSPGKKKFSQDEWKEIIDRTVSRTRQVFNGISEEELKADLVKILDTLEGIATKNIKEYKGKYLSLKQYAPFIIAPHRMDLMVSAMKKDGVWNCTNNCVLCYACGEPKSELEELDTASWKRIIDICRENHIPQLTFTGGEPTMREDLPELIAYASWFVTRLNTNGTLLSEELCTRLKEASLDNIQITLYSSDEKIHNALVGNETFEKTKQGIINALKVGLDVSVNTPICSLNSDYVKTLEFLKSLGVEYVTCSGIIQGGAAIDENATSYGLSEDELLKILATAKRYCDKNNMDINFTLPGCVDEKKLKSIGFQPPVCGACLSNMAIAPDGTVVPCQSWLNEKRDLGNILHTNWKEIWNNRLCRSIRRKSEKELFQCLLPSRRKNK